MSKQIMYFSQCPLQKPSKQLVGIIESIEGTLVKTTVTEGLQRKIVSVKNGCQCEVRLQFTGQEKDWAPLTLKGEQQSKNKTYCEGITYNIEDIPKEQQKVMHKLFKPYKIGLV